MTNFLETFHFLRPAWLLALAPVALLGWWMLRHDDPVGDLKQAIAPHLLRSLMVSPQSRKPLRPAVLAIVIWVIGVIALAGPTWRQVPPPWVEDQSSLYFVLRMTPSMVSEDLHPSRLEQVRAKLHDLMKLRRGSRNGLIAYGKSAHLVMPATGDVGVIDQMLQSLDPAIMPGEGDSLAEALTMASRRIEESGNGGSILIIADGSEANQTQPLKAWREKDKTPVQWLVPVPPDTSLDALGIATAADALETSPRVMTPDEQDIVAIQQSAKTTYTTGGSEATAHWADAGVWLVWPVALGLACWFRKGWSIVQ